MDNSKDLKVHQEEKEKEEEKENFKIRLVEFQVFRILFFLSSALTLYFVIKTFNAATFYFYVSDVNFNCLIFNFSMLVVNVACHYFSRFKMMSLDLF